LKDQIKCYRRSPECGGRFVEYNVIEGVFTTFFFAELVLRFIEGNVLPDGTTQSRCRYFFTGPERIWNCFDSILVLSSLADIACQIARVETDTVSWIKSSLVLMRVVRLLRVMRVIRVLRFFRSLRLMLASISHSVTELFWVFVLLFFIIYMFTIFIQGVMTEHFRDGDFQKPISTHNEFVIEHFGTISATMVSLYQSISGGRDWQEFYFPLLDISDWCGWVFLLFIFFVVFGVLNVVTGAFVDSMRLVSQRDNDLVIEQELAKETAFKTEVKAIFEDADLDGSGTLSWEEFQSHLTNERIRAYFASLQLDISEAKALFVLLDVEKNGEVPIEKFILGCLRMRGDAKSIDVNMILYENEKMLGMLTSLNDKCEDMFDRLEEGVQETRRGILTLKTAGGEKERRKSVAPIQGKPLLDEQQMAHLQALHQSVSTDDESRRQSGVPRRQSEGPPTSRFGAAFEAVERCESRRRASNASVLSDDPLSSARLQSFRLP
jgi:Ca2+-binding EF-hand superfamily protein